MPHHRFSDEERQYGRLCAALVNVMPPTLAEFHTLEPIAQKHAVRALLRDRVLAQTLSDGTTPRAHTAALTDIALREAALEARRNEAVSTVVEALAAAGVPALIFKGTALAHSHYPRPELRERDDTDLAIHHEHLAVAAKVLHRLGFAAVAANEGTLIMRQRLYRRRDGDGLMHHLDLHWQISNSTRTNRLTVRALLARSIELSALSRYARAPEPIDALLIACAHLDAHHVHEVRLVWLVDLHLMIERMSVATRVRASQRAIACDVLPACAWVLSMLSETLGTSLNGFEALRTKETIAPPRAHRVAQWWRELQSLRTNRERCIWLWQHMVPDARYLRDERHADAPLWRLVFARLYRGVIRGLRDLVSRPR